MIVDLAGVGSYARLVISAPRRGAQVADEIRSAAAEAQSFGVRRR